TRPFSLDHLIRSRQHVRWDREADLLCSLKIDYKLELRRLLHGEVRRRSAFQDLVHVSRGAPKQVGKAGAVAHKPPGFDKFWRVIYRREPVLCREICNLCSVRLDDGARQHEDCASTPLACVAECSLNILET